MNTCFCFNRTQTFNMSETLALIMSHCHRWAPCVKGRSKRLPHASAWNNKRRKTTLECWDLGTRLSGSIQWCIYRLYHWLCMKTVSLFLSGRAVQIRLNTKSHDRKSESWWIHNRGCCMRPVEQWCCEATDEMLVKTNWCEVIRRRSVKTIEELLFEPTYLSRSSETNNQFPVTDVSFQMSEKVQNILSSKMSLTVPSLDRLHWRLHTRRIKTLKTVQRFDLTDFCKNGVHLSGTNILRTEDLLWGVCATSCFLTLQDTHKVSQLEAARWN